MRRFLLQLAWLAIFLCVPVRTTAPEAEAAAPLKVQAVFEAQFPLTGMQFDAYRVADRSDDGTWSLEPRFKAYQTRLETQSGGTEAWAALARVLEKVALMEEACLPDASAETDEDGTAVLDALRPGLYLLSGQSVCVNRQIYTPSPLLIVCPAECEAEPELTRSPEKADYSVQIVWDDEKTPQRSRIRFLGRRKRTCRRTKIAAGWRYRRSCCSPQRESFCGNREKNQRKLDCKPA